MRRFLSHEEILRAPALLLTVNLLVLWPALSPLRGPVTLAVALLLPGALAVRALRIPVPRGWLWILHVLPLSLAGLLATAAAIVLSGARLTTVSCLIGLDVLVVALLACCPRPAGAPARLSRISPVAAAALVLGAAAVACAVLGAARLNDGGGSGLSELGLALAAAALAAAAAGARRNPAAAATAVYLIALAVLFATSLRGTAVTGHDIKLEYRVFTDVLDTGRWQPRSSFIGYNSCLSITVLPALLARLSGIAALDVFRVCFQMLFAIVPVGVWLVARRFVPAPAAVLAAGLFVAFPTFVNDMPMLNRQEIALIFFTALMLVATGARGQRQRSRALLIGVLLGGLTVSHYSTAYVAVVLLLGAWLVRLRRSAPALHGVLGGAGLALLALTVAWATVTGSAPELGGHLRTAADALTGQLASGREDPALVPATVPPGRSAQEMLESYVGRLHPWPAPVPGCVPVALEPSLLPVTPAGAFLGRLGVPPGNLNATLRVGSVGVFEGGAALGIVLLGVREWRLRRRRRRAPTALPDLSVTAILLLALPVVSPSLAASYGPQRLYQQLLIVLGPAVLVALRAPWPAGRRERAGRAVAALVVVGCFLSTSGLVPQATGGYPAQLSMNNSGPVYDAFYAGTDDLRMADWIRAHLAAGTPILADGHDSLDIRAMTRLDPAGELFPGTVPDASHMLLRTPDGRTATALVTLPDRSVRYRLPLRCVARDRPLLYASGVLRLYGPATVSRPG